MKKIFIWLDDERCISSQWLQRVREGALDYKIFRTAEDLIEWYDAESAHYDKIFASFDHDLGLGKNGYDVAKYIVEHHKKLDGYAVHSMNPAGRKNILDTLGHHGYYNMRYTNEILIR